MFRLHHTNAPTTTIANNRLATTTTTISATTATTSAQGDHLGLEVPHLLPQPRLLVLGRARGVLVVLGRHHAALDLVLDRRPELLLRGREDAHRALELVVPALELARSAVRSLKVGRELGEAPPRVLRLPV
jgi:hypothetical protein